MTTLQDDLAYLRAVCKKVLEVHGKVESPRWQVYGRSLEERKANAELIALYRGVCPVLAKAILVMFDGAEDWDEFSWEPELAALHEMVADFRSKGIAV